MLHLLGLLGVISLALLPFESRGARPPPLKRVEGLIELTTQNYKQAVERHKRLLVIFHDPSCRTAHCLHVAHDFRMAVHEYRHGCMASLGSLSSPDNFIDFAEADITSIQNKTLLSHVGTTPVVFLVYRSHLVPYIHEVDKTVLVDWLRLQSRPTLVRETHNVDELRKILATHRVVVVYKGNKETDQYAYFLSLAKELKGVKFVYYDGAEYETVLMGMGYSRVLLHKVSEMLPTLAFKGTGYKAMRDFIIQHSHTQPVEENPQSLAMVHQNHVPCLLLTCRDGIDCQKHMEVFNHSIFHTSKLIRMFKVDPGLDYSLETDPVALNQTLNVIPLRLIKDRDIHLIDLETYKAPGEGDFLVHSGPTVLYRPKVSILDTRRWGNHHNHHMPEDIPFTKENLESFVERFLAVRKEAHHYCNDHPEDFHHSHVKAITGHNYAREVLHTRRGILILLHNGLKEEKPFLKQFETVAYFFHHKIGHYFKFRTLNQRAILTPVKPHSSVTLLLVPLNTQAHLELWQEYPLSAEVNITRRLVQEILHTKASLSLEEVWEEELGSEDL